LFVASMIADYGTRISGLLNLLDERTPMSLQITFALISGIGVGMLFHPPYQVFTRALTPSEIGPATSAFFLVRFTGATIGLVSPIPILACHSFDTTRPWQGRYFTADYQGFCLQT
jgi:hypothetical protein